MEAPDSDGSLITFLGCPFDENKLKFHLEECGIRKCDDYEKGMGCQSAYH